MINIGILTIDNFLILYLKFYSKSKPHFYSYLALYLFVFSHSDEVRRNYFRNCFILLNKNFKMIPIKHIPINLLIVATFYMRFKFKLFDDFISSILLRYVTVRNDLKLVAPFIKTYVCRKWITWLQQSLMFYTSTKLAYDTSSSDQQSQVIKDVGQTVIVLRLFLLLKMYRSLSFAVFGQCVHAGGRLQVYNR